MSASAPTGLNYAEQITRINNLQADTMAKMAAAGKSDTESKWMPWQVAIGGFTSGAATIGAIVALLKLLHG